MEAKLTELEEAVSRTVRRLAELRESSREGASPPSRKGSPSPSTAALSRSLTELSSENRRLREERKELRKRVRAIIRTIDKVKW